MGKLFGLIFILAGIAIGWFSPVPSIAGLGIFWVAAVLVIIGIVMVFKKAKPRY